MVTATLVGVVVLVWCVSLRTPVWTVGGKLSAVRPAEECWSHIIDFARHKKWNRVALPVLEIPELGLYEGAKFTNIVNRSAGNKEPEVVTTFDPLQHVLCWQWTRLFPLGYGHHCWHVTASSDITCEIDDYESFYGPLGLIMRLLGAEFLEMEPAWSDSHAALKNELESEDAAEV